MVVEKTINVFVCEGCKKEFWTLEAAKACEKIHAEEWIKKFYVHGDYNVSELMEVYNLTEREAIIIQSDLAELEILIKFKDNLISLIGVNGYYINEESVYNSNDFE